jgi:5''-nucleotidase, lipoprotein e(P4) family
MRPLHSSLSPYTFVAFVSALAPAVASAQTPHPEDPAARMESALLWTQSSGEWRALCYQGWNIARVQLDALLPQPRTKPPAVVVDIDETVLDNSPYHAGLIVAGDGSIPKWADWINSASAQPIPGALEFLRYAVSRGVEVFYITNRTVAEEPATLENLEKFGFPQVDKDHVLVRTAEGSKDRRRATVAEQHDILLLCGDNLGDFAGFDDRTVEDRNAMTDELRGQFGRRFIVFPNTFVGDWQSALYRAPTRQPGETREQQRRKHLRPWHGK